MKLNLRDLFWLIFVSAVATMWWIDRSKLADRLKFYEGPPLAQPGFNPADDPFGGPAPTSAPPVDDPFAPAAAAPPKPPAVDPFG